MRRLLILAALAGLVLLYSCAPKEPPSAPPRLESEEKVPIEAAPSTPEVQKEKPPVPTASLIAGSGNKCEDSDGYEPRIQGITKGVSEGKTFELKDYCIGPFLVEFYCEGNDVVSQNLRCEEGKRCVDGSCV